MEDIYVGLEVHKHTVVATAINAQGRKISQAKFGPTDSEMVAFLDGLVGVKHVALEACSVWEHYFDAAASTGAEVVLSHPKKTRLISEATLKTDKVDSEALAELQRLHGLPQAYAPTSDIRQLRDLVRERIFYLQKEVAIRNHTYCYLNRKGIPFEEGVLSLKRKRQELRPLHLEVVDRALDLLDEVNGTTYGLDKRLREEASNSKEAQLLMSVPGVGFVTAMTLVAFLTPIERFANVDACSSYCGLCPTVSQSGERSFHGHLTNDCNQILRWVLVEASWGARKYDRRGDVARVGNRIARRKGSGRGAIAAAHTLMKICYAVLKRGTPFEAHVPGLNGRRTLAAGCSRSAASN